MSEATISDRPVTEPSVQLGRRASLDDAVGRYRRMLEIRLTEDVIKELFAAGLVAGSTHTCQGQEAVSVGIAASIRPSDLVSCTYRGHGHALALGMEPHVLLAEILGRTDGCVGGLGGSMHLSSMEIGLTPTTAIVGAGIPIAAGAALAAQLRGGDNVAIGVFGEGASNIGAFHEGLNLAAIWNLPVVYICENNLYGEYSPMHVTTSIENVAERAAAYSMPGEVVDGQDLDGVMDAVSRAVERARNDGGPTLLEMKTYRYAGHSRSDPATYRPDGELAAWQARDPLDIAAAKLLADGVVDDEWLTSVRSDVQAEVHAAVERAKASPSPELGEIFAHVLAGSRGRLS